MEKSSIQVQVAVNIIDVLNYYTNNNFITQNDNDLVWDYLCLNEITNDTTINNCLKTEYFSKENEPELYQFAEKFEKDYPVSHLIISW